MKLSDNKMIKNVLLFIAFLTVAVVKASDDNKDRPYEPADGMCSKCNCTSVNGTLEDAENGRAFTLDCAMKNFQRLFAKYPQEMSDNHTGTELFYIMSLNDLGFLQQLPPTDAILYFTCRHCKITSIESHAFIDTENIKVLDLAFNEIKSTELFPEIFKGPDNDEEYAPIMLETLDLSHNQISFFEKILFEHTPHLRSLDISYNPINQLDEPSQLALSSLHKLEILDLSHIGIMELPGIVLEHMEKLSEIFLNGNKFLTVPESLVTVGNSLQFLHLSENPIEEVNNQSFVGLLKVQQLNISAMPDLKEITKDSFKPMTSLEVLHCRGNKKLSKFNMEDLLDLKHLKDLDISHNALRDLDFGEVEKLTHVEKVGVDKVQHEDNKYFEKLRLLKLAGNPWHCDCGIMKSLSLFDHNATYFKKSVNNDEARCETPYDLLSKHLYDLPMDYICVSHAKNREPKIPIYDPPQFLRPKSIMLTVFSVIGVVVLGIFIGFAIVCIKRKLKSDDVGYASSPIRYTTVRDSTISNVANAPYVT